MSKLFAAFIGLFLLNACQSSLVDKDPIIISLNDSQWLFSEKDSVQQLPATVPGSVQMDLLNNGIIEDPYYGDNEKDLQWIGERDWNYETTFEVTNEILNQQQIELCFDGLDTYADVYLNGEKVITANNYFRVWSADVSSKLTAGSNHLEVKFTSPVQVNKDLRKADSIELFDDYVYTRKPSFHFGWDWGPIYITAGIWRPVYLKAWSGGVITDNHIVQKKVSAELAQCHAIIEVEAYEAGPAQVSVQCDEANIDQLVDFTLKKGLNTLQIPFEIKKPKLWWSNGLGEAHLYNVKTKLIQHNAILDRNETVIGVRELKLVQNPDSQGASFHFELNGIPVFAKGANYIPQESFQSKVDSSDYQRVIKHALDANMNMLRVWGGGFYEEDYFYDLCDQNGILVWQDFMFACSMYPGEPDYLENVKQEAIENVKRLRNHPSIALWCGNNENYIGWKDWRWPAKFEKEDSATVWNDYLTLFEELLPEVIAEYDTGKDYWPSSPKHGWGYPVNSDGDSHLWAVWHAQDPFEVLLEKENIPRFMSEYGFQSLPEMKTIEAFTLPEDRDIDSDVMKAHQKHRVGYPVIDKYLKRDYNWPKDFESYVYVSQILQAKGIKMGIEAHRRAMPFCMGTLYWQINDCWPVASWSSVDYYNRWKALHYKVRDAYANVLVSPVTNGDKVDVYIVSDRQEENSGQLHLKVQDFDGNEIWTRELDVVAPANNSQILVSPAIAELLNGKDASEVLLSVSLLEKDLVVAQNTHYFVAPKALNLKPADIRYDIKKLDTNSFVIELQTNVFAKDVCITVVDQEGLLSDNYFDLVPGETKIVNFKMDSPTEAKNIDLNIMSLRDSY